MRTEKEIYDLVLNFAFQDERIRIVTLEGSRTNVNIPKDNLQDYDITFFVIDMGEFLKSDDWLSVFSSPDNNSSIDTEKNFEIAFNDSILGTPLPDSHLEIAVRDTNNASASSSCVSPFSFLNSCNFSLNSIINIPFALRYECILY